MNNDFAVSGKNISKRYVIYPKPTDRLLEFISRGKIRRRMEIWALHNVSFKISKGQTYAIIGKNGSGKSTLLQVICGILRPTQGELIVNGRITAILELGAGFNPEFTGTENVMIYGALMGIDQKEMQERFKEIKDFAGIGEFIKLPVKTYSTGMYVRLAFATAINLDPDILVVDEVLAVGDAQFQHRCMFKVRELQKQGKTIVFVSHDVGAIRALCQEAMLLEQGETIAVGPAKEMIELYFSRLSKETSGKIGPIDDNIGIGSNDFDICEEITELPPENNIPNIDNRYGNGHAKIRGLAIYDCANNKINAIEHGNPIKIRVTVEYLKKLKSPIIGFLMRDRLGQDVIGTNSAIEGINFKPAESGQIQTVEFLVRLPILFPGNYSISVAVANGDLTSYEMCDWIDNADNIQLMPKHTTVSLVRCPISIKQSIKIK